MKLIKWDGVNFPSEHHIRFWYDRSIRLWVAAEYDAECNQIGNAEYSAFPTLYKRFACHDKVQVLKMPII